MPRELSGGARSGAGGTILVGTAGWSIPKACAADFPGEGSHLERYARQLPAVEINSSFHRPHRTLTYERWAAAVPAGFRFSVKLPKAITHVRRLVDAADLLDAFAAETAGLGEKLDAVLVQLPPSLAFDEPVAASFFDALRHRLKGKVVCEPRHPTWFAPDADAALVRHRVARVAAHPVLVAGGERPGGWQGLHYHRLHGAPRVYYSSYEQPFLAELADTLRTSGDAGTERWCIFDNTASGAAAGNALALRTLLAG